MLPPLFAMMAPISTAPGFSYNDPPARSDWKSATVEDWAILALHWSTA
jgi:hypothetical protein